MKIFGLEKSAIVDALTSGRLTVAVYGLGKMGLPLAAVFAEKGAKVIGVDYNQKVVDEVNKGGCPVLGEPGLPEMLKANIAKGRLSATTDGVGAAKKSDVMIIIVPSSLNKDNSPNLTAVTSVCSSISQGLSKGDLVILETTVPPRTTKDLVLPILKQSGLREGEFGLAFCPERTMSGRAIRDITGAYLKVVGGVNKKSTETAEAIYSVINEKGVVTVSDATTAEAIKVFEGIYRDVNIALSNELAILSKEIGVDAIEVFRIANEPFNVETNRHYCNFHAPGAGAGGHCIPVYPYFVIKTTKANTGLIELARRINDSMSSHMVDSVKEGLNSAGKTIEDSNVLILGLAFRDGVKEAGNSPAIPIVKKLQKSGASVYLYDPLFSKKEIENHGAKYANDFKGMDCVVVVTDHKEFYDLDWEEIKGKMRTNVLVDGRQVVDPKKMKELGFVYRGVGRWG